MKGKIEAYKRKLEMCMADYMEQCVSERYVCSVKDMAKCWKELDELEDVMHHVKADSLKPEDANCWNSKMRNVDGTMGGHWTVDQTTELAQSLGVEFTHISPWCWNVTCNMMYSDYCSVARAFGTDIPNWYGSMAKAFLFDPDGLPPKEKVAAFYNHVVKPSWEEESTT